MKLMGRCSLSATVMVMCVMKYAHSHAVIVTATGNENVDRRLTGIAQMSFVTSSCRSLLQGWPWLPMCYSLVVVVVYRYGVDVLLLL
jgi:hypothetical protein